MSKNSKKRKALREESLIVENNEAVKNNIFLNHKRTFTALAIFFFVATFVASIIGFWGSLSTVIGAGGILNKALEFPVYYFVFSCLFAVSFLALVVLGGYFKNRLLISIPLIYFIITLITTICFAILTTDVNQAAYIITILMFAMFSPLYGFCYITYVWCLFYIIPVFFATIIVAFKVFRFHFQQKKNKQKKK